MYQSARQNSTSKSRPSFLREERNKHCQSQLSARMGVKVRPTSATQQGKNSASKSFPRGEEWELTREPIHSISRQRRRSSCPSIQGVFQFSSTRKSEMKIWLHSTSKTVFSYIYIGNLFKGIHPRVIEYIAG